MTNITAVLNEMQLSNFKKVRSNTPADQQNSVNYQLLMTAANLHESLANIFEAQDLRTVARNHRDLANKMRSQANVFVTTS